MVPMSSLVTMETTDFDEFVGTVLSEAVTSYFAGRKQRLSILEAGCGQTWFLKLQGLDYRLTGLDASPKAMELRQRVAGDLDDMIVGDLRTVDLETGQFDLIYCSFVLEHVNGAEAVLDRFFRWLKPDGVLVLVIPDRDSTVGFVTRAMPYWFHVWFHRYVLKYPQAGTAGYAPFPTYYDKIVSRRGIQSYCESNGKEILLERGNPGQIDSRLKPAYRVPLGLLFKLLWLLSLGRLSCDHSGLFYIIRNSSQGRE